MNWRNDMLDSPYNNYDSAREEKVQEYIAKYGLPDDFDESIDDEPEMWDLEDRFDYLIGDRLDYAMEL
jgi:hypothetical protein